jgi:hypothetical protein
MNLLLLEVLLLAGPAPDRSERADEVATFHLRANTNGAACDYPVLEDEEGQRQIVELDAQLRQRLARDGRREEWEGEYFFGGGYVGESLVIADGRFARRLSHCTGNIAEAGAVLLVDGTLELRKQIGPLEWPPPYSQRGALRRETYDLLGHCLIPTLCGGGMYLLEARDMLGFVDLVASGDSEHLKAYTRYRHRNGDPFAGPRSQVDIPAGYRKIWQALPHLRLLQLTVAHDSKSAQIELESDGSPRNIDRPGTFYWDGDPSGQTRAIEFDRIEQRPLAYFPQAEGLSTERIEVGSTFTRLPNLR